MEANKYSMKFLFLLLILFSVSIGKSSNIRYGAGLDIGSKGSGFFFNYVIGNLDKNLDLVFESRNLCLKSVSSSFSYIGLCCVG